MLLLGAAAAVVTILGLQQLAWLLAPVFLALVVVIVVHPVHGWLRRHRWPEAVALLVLLLAIYGVLVAIVVIVVLSLAQLTTILPSYSASAREVVGSLVQLLDGFGIGAAEKQALVSALDLRRLIAPLMSLLRSVVGFGANVAFLLSLLLFLGIESVGAGARLAALAASRPAVAQALVAFATNTRRFLTVTTVFGLLTGLSNTVLLLWLDIPLALVWGLLAAICNYIPYVGFVIGLVPPALLALLGGDWRLMLFVIVCYILLNTLFTTLIQSHFVGDAVGISMTTTLTALLFWAWVLGPLGAILAIPLTLLVKGLLIDSDPRAGWAEALIGSTKRHRATAEHSEPAPAATPVEKPEAPTPPSTDADE